MSRSTIHRLLGLFLSSTIVYGVLTYGAIRFPDCAVVYLTAESLATTGSFAVPHDLPTWPGFGFSPGRDGKRYSVFGPGLAVAAAPFVRLGMLVNQTKWYARVPEWVRVSMYVDARFTHYSAPGRRPQDLAPHALRWIVCSLNVLVGALGVAVFFLLLRSLTHSDTAALWVSLLFAFGSLWMPYTGTFFSEPLATLLALVSLYFLVGNEVALRAGSPTRRCYFNTLAAGLFLGMAVTAHLTAMLFVPFYLAYAIYPFFQKTRFAGGTLWGTCTWLAGLGLLLAMLGYYNYIRFGSPFETGRWVDPALARNCGYGTFVAPWQGLYQLLFGSGKGLFLFCPAIAISVLWCKRSWQQYRFLTFMIFAAALFRVGFIASRSDWHGGFCLGPRYLLLITPLLLLPLGPCVAGWLAAGNRRALGCFAAGAIVCAMQAAYFCVGDIDNFYFMLKLDSLRAQRHIFSDNLIYTSWQISPLLHLLEAQRSPALLQFIPVDNYTLFACLATFCAGVLALVYRKLLPAPLPPPARASTRAAVALKKRSRR